MDVNSFSVILKALKPQSVQIEVDIGDGQDSGERWIRCRQRKAVPERCFRPTPHSLRRFYLVFHNLRLHRRTGHLQQHTTLLIYVYSELIFRRLFGLVLELPNLESLRMSSRMTRVTRVVLDALLNKDNLTSLVELDLDLMPFQGKGLVHLHSLYPRLTRLRKLGLAGSWYLEETGAHISGQSNPDPWKLESLRTPRQHLRILRMCGHLRRLGLTHNQHAVEPTSLSPLFSCPEPQELIIARRGFNFLDFGRTLPHLYALTLLKISISRQEQFLQLHILTDKHITPALRHLEVTYRSATASGLEHLLAACQDLMLTILVTRKKMEVFVLEGVAIEAAIDGK
ncbi:hypothetical protein KI688_009692 [Linnemannia hyalina]|uniref:Uncharacterized protein n=1 Tax=Linnemannia hyalina TaxID=64524 RepID=A0A9P7XZW0_9FUNG|nr:hypothetical protein KI688_009692 [Linnemannia hyalina]